MGVTKEEQIKERLQNLFDKNDKAHYLISFNYGEIAIKEVEGDLIEENRRLEEDLEESRGDTDFHIEENRRLNKDADFYQKENEKLTERNKKLQEDYNRIKGYIDKY